MPVLRQERDEDHEVLRKLNRFASGGNGEAKLIDQLRSAGLVVVSLVATEDDEIVGHILFSELSIETDNGIIDAVSLAPMCVSPKYQRQGIGSALVDRWLSLCWERGKSIVVVLGHPGYYSRFGFSSEVAKNLHSPFSGRAWMALELRRGALDNVTGTVRFPEAFEVLEHPTTLGSNW